MRSHLGNPREFAETWDAVTESELTPWYRETVEEDRDRLREIEALRKRLEPAPPSDQPAELRAALQVAAPQDPDVYRAFLANRSCLQLQQELRADSSVVERILELGRNGDQRPCLAPTVISC